MAVDFSLQHWSRVREEAAALRLGGVVDRIAFDLSSFLRCPES